MSGIRVIMKVHAAVLAAVISISCFGTSGGNRAAGDSASAPLAGQAESAGKANGFPVHYTYTVKNVYPHSEGSYTQGLYWHDGYLWEGTGQYGQSALMQVDLRTGEALRTVELDAGYFGEGIALLNNRIYQLTWLEGECLVYDAETLGMVGSFEYAGQGWGLTTDGTYLYMSNGSHEIFVVDPADFRRRNTIRVSVGRRRLNQLNELEWINGRIWANIYGLDQIAIINPEDGVVEGLVNLEGLLPDSERTPRTDVLNGIAYDETTGRIFVTGKNWSRLFEIEIIEV
ncbi:MAG: glutaminyl-peptide cyclotransferase [Rikenellaceae bacterium]|nr:glutaminyl-peptide cyclotransferase [Rikenellaceae bacterium]